MGANDAKARLLGWANRSGDSGFRAAAAILTQTHVWDDASRYVDPRGCPDLALLLAQERHLSGTARFLAVLAENLAFGATSTRPLDLTTLWSLDPGHRAVVLGMCDKPSHERSHKTRAPDGPTATPIGDGSWQGPCCSLWRVQSAAVPPGNGTPVHRSGDELRLAERRRRWLAPRSTEAARVMSRSDSCGCAGCALVTTGHPAARAAEVSPPMTPNAKGKLLAPNTATRPTGTRTVRRSA